MGTLSRLATSAANADPIGSGVPDSRDGPTLTSCDQGRSLAIVTVQPSDVRAYGPSPAILLAMLREQGSSPSIPVLLKYAQAGRLCGLDRRTVARALRILKDAGAVRVEPFRAAGSLLVRTVQGAPECTETDQGQQHQPTHGGRDGLARLATLRSLLEAVG